MPEEERMEIQQEKEDSCEKYDSLVACSNKFIQSIRDKQGTCKKLAKAFPKCYKECPEIIQTISDQAWDAFEANQKQHIMELISEFGLKSSLCRLANTDTDDNGTYVWRPTGDPQNDVKAYISKAKDAEIGRLTEMLQEQRSKTEVMRSELTRKEKKLRSLLTDLEEDVGHWEEMSVCCEDKIQILSKAERQILEMDE